MSRAHLLPRPVSVAGFLLAGAASALAQSTPATSSSADDSTVRLDEFTVSAAQDRGYLSTHSVSGTRTNTALKDIPQKISIINSELISDSASFTTADATRFISNVNSQSFRDDAFRIRGLDAGQVVSNGFNLNAGVQNELSHVDRIEVVKGPAAVLYGTGRFGGVINLVRKRPQEKAAYAFSAQYKSTEWQRLEADATGPVYTNEKLKLLYRVTGSVADGEEFFDYSQRDRFAISPALELRYGDKTRVTAYWEYLDETRTNYWGDHLGRNAAGVFNVFLNPDRKVNFRPGAIRGTNHDIYAIEGEHRFSDAFTVRLATVYYTGGHYDSGGGGHRLLPDNRTIHLYTDYQVFDRDRLRTQLDFLGKFELGPTKHNILAGSEWTHLDWSTSKLWQPRAQFENRLANPWQVIDLYNPRATPPRDPSFSAIIDPVMPRNLVPPKDYQWFDTPTNYYVQDQIKVFNDRLVITAGVRRDEYTNTVVNPFTNAVESNTKSQWSPRVGFVFNFTPEVGIYAIQSKGFQPQTGFDFFTGSPISPTTGDVIEGGFKFNLLNGRVVGTISYFEQTQEDIVTTVFDTTTGTFASVGVTQGGVWKSKGFEGDFVFSINENWQIIASYGTSDPRVEEDTDPRNVGKRFENAPDMTWSFWTKYTPAAGPLLGWSFGGGVFHSDEKAGDRANNFFVDAYERVDVFASYRFSKNYSVAVNVNNVLDEYYYSESRAYRDLIFGEPRTFTFSVTGRF